MTEEFEEQQQRRYIRMRSINDYSRGTIFILFGCFFIFFQKFNIKGLVYQDWFAYIGSLFVVYGLWRIYRGYKKNYFR